MSAKREMERLRKAADAAASQADAGDEEPGAILHLPDNHRGDVDREHLPRWLKIEDSPPPPTLPEPEPDEDAGDVGSMHDADEPEPPDPSKPPDLRPL